MRGRGAETERKGWGRRENGWGGGGKGCRRWDEGMGKVGWRRKQGCRSRRFRRRAAGALGM